MDESTLVEIQQQIASLGNSQARIEGKLDALISESSSNEQRIREIETQLVPKKDIDTMFKKMRKVEPFLHIWSWFWKIVLAALAVVLTGVFVAIFTDVKHTITKNETLNQVIERLDDFDRREKTVNQMLNYLEQMKVE
jgi:hypothetical protein